MNKSDFTVTTDSAAQPRLAIGKAQLGLGDQTQGLDSLPQGIAIARNVDNLSRPRELSLAYQDILIERGEYLIALDYLKVLTISLEASGVAECSIYAHRLLASAHAVLRAFSVPILIVWLQIQLKKQRKVMKRHAG